MSSEAHDATSNPDEAQSGARSADGAAGNGAQGGPRSEGAPAEISLEAIAEETPPVLIGEIMALSGIAEADERYAEVEAGLRAFVGFALRGGVHADGLDPPGVDALIVELTAKMSAQIDEILHHPKFQQLEAAWRSLKFVVDRVDFRLSVSGTIAAAGGLGGACPADGTPGLPTSRRLS